MGTKQGGTHLVHGAYGMDTCFKVTSHDYAGGEIGYYEVLEIHDAPAGYQKFILLMYDGRAGFQFCYGETLKAVTDAKSAMYGNNWLAKWAKIPGITKVIDPPSEHCVPWCYAEVKDLVCGDYALPSEIFRDTLVYPAGSQWLVLGMIKPTIEVIQGYVRKENQLSIYFNDGSIVRFRASEGPETILSLDDRLLYKFGGFWNHFLSNGLGEKEQGSCTEMLNGNKATLKLFEYGDDFNFQFEIQGSSTEECLIAYSCFSFSRKQLTSTLISGDITFAHVLCKIFEK